MSDIGLFGLAVMGQNFALNMAEHGFSVSVANRSPEKVDTTVKRAQTEGPGGKPLPLTGHKDMKEFVASLAKPRKIIILVMAGAPVDATIKGLVEAGLEEGDLVIDGGNEWFPNSLRRAKELEPKGIMFMGMGISGGEEGARKGPSLMPGGPPAAYALMEPIITKCSAQVGGEPCTFNIGDVGSGNYVKMIHNGIEYGDMQLIAEIYDVLRYAGEMDNEELAATFKSWHEDTELNSFLIEITGIILGTKDDQEGKDGYIVDQILDKTGMKGTGRWTIQEAAERSVCGSVMAAALDARYVSGRKDERVAASSILGGPVEVPRVDKEQLIDDCRQALFAAKIVSYAQGLCLIREAGVQLGWAIDLGECARIWRGGCIIRAQFLNDITEAFKSNPGLTNLMVDPKFSAWLNERQPSWRRVVSLCVASGLPVPALSASIAYFDSYRRANVNANLVQGMRDFFGGHTFERKDMEGKFHCYWTEGHKPLDDIASRTGGEV
jgi:6-phosphogluconate dehydrogenase